MQKESLGTELNYYGKMMDYKKLCKQSKKTDFKDFLETLPDIQSMSKLHKALGSLKNPKIKHY